MTNSLILAIYIVMGIYIGVEAYKGSSLEEKSNRLGYIDNRNEKLYDT